MRIGKGLLKIFFFQLNEYAIVEQYLNEMALNGWMLDKIWFMFFKFKQMEAADRTFSASMMDLKNEHEEWEEQETYIEYCERVGWKYICDDQGIFYFYTEDSETVPIETDPEIEFNLIHTGIKRKKLPLWIGFLIVAIAELYIAGKEFTGFIASNYAIAFALGMVMTGLFISYEAIQYFIWYFASLRKLKEGNKPILKIGNKAKFFRILCVVGAVGFFSYGLLSATLLEGAKSAQAWYPVMLFGGTLGADLITKSINWRKGNKEKSETNDKLFRTIFAFTLFVIYTAFLIRSDFFTPSQQEAKLAIAEKTKSVYSTVRKSFLAKETDYTDYSSTTGSVSGEYYEVVESPYRWVIYEVLQSEKRPDSAYDDKYEKIDPAPWQADAAYCRKDTIGFYKYLLVYKNKVLIYSGVQRNDEIMQKLIGQLELNKYAF